MDYIPLDIPNMPNNATYANTATWLADTADAVASSAASYLQSLSDLRSTDFFSVGDVPSFFEPIFYSGGLSAAAFVRPARPDMTPPSMQALFDQLNNLVLPTAPTLTFSYTDPGYASAMRDSMIAKLLADLLNGGYGIDTNDEAAIWNRERDREVAAAQANIAELMRQAASTSFPMPQGALYAAIQRARQDLLNKTSSVNRDIGLKRADLYVEQRRRVIEQVISVESQSIALYNAIQGRGLELAKTQVGMAISLFQSGIEFFKTKVDAIKSQVEAQAEFSKVAVATYSADTAMYQVYVNALIADSQAFIQNQRNILDKDKTTLFASVEQVKFRLEQLRLGVDNAKDLNKYGAEFFRTGLGSALNGVNGLAVQTADVSVAA